MNIMGWGNHPRALRPKPVQPPLPTTTSTSTTTDPLEPDLDDSSVQRVEDIVIDNTEYPILPRETAKEALPFIEASEVRKRDGENHPRLCVYIHVLPPPLSFFFCLIAAGRPGC